MYATFRSIRLFPNKILYWALAVSSCLLIACPAHAQIVGSATGVIDLQLDPGRDLNWEGEPTVIQAETIPVGLYDRIESIDGAGYDFVGGLSRIDYEYMPIGLSEAWFLVHATADTLGQLDGGGGSASVDVDLTIPAPFYYRFEGELLDSPVYFEVSFAQESAYAARDPYFGEIYGTFPVIYYEEEGQDPHPVGWDTYVDEGILPAGTYEMNVRALSSVHGRYMVGLDTIGEARLHIRMLGDANQDGYVGINDLNAVLNHWGRDVPDGVTQFGDLDCDGYVGIADLNAVLGSWNLDVRPEDHVVPEPLSAVAFGLSGLVLFVCRNS